MKKYIVCQTVGVEVYAEETRPYDDELHDELVEKALKIPLENWHQRCEGGMFVIPQLTNYELTNGPW